MSTPKPRWTVHDMRALPKAELHVHLEGAMPPAIALQLAQRRGVQLPGAEGGIEGLRDAYRFRDFADFIKLYVAVSKCLCEAEDFADASEAVARAMAADGIVYAETTFTPMTHVARGVDPEAMLAGLAEGQVRAREQHGVTLAWVFDIVRSFPDQGPATVELLTRARAMGQRVVGLGVGGPEGERWPAQPLAESFARAKAQGLASLPHAGEQHGAQSVRDAVEILGADRIGHGVRCLEDPEVVELVRARNIPLEVCPTSNVVLKVVEDLAHHPLPQLIEAGLSVSLNSDDPPMFGTTLSAEYLQCAEQFAWDANFVADLARAAVEHSYLQGDEAKQLLGAQRQWLEAHLAPPHASNSSP